MTANTARTLVTEWTWGQVLQQHRRRLNRGGDRQANSALWRIVLVRMKTHQQTRDYVARRTAEGMSKRDIMRCLKRYVAREVYHALSSSGPRVPHIAPAVPDSRQSCRSAGAVKMEPPTGGTILTASSTGIPFRALGTAHITERTLTKII